MRRRRIVVAGLIALAAAPASAQWVPGPLSTIPPEEPVAYTLLETPTLRIPLPGFARVRSAVTWARLWKQFDVGDSTGRRLPAPRVDFATHELLVVTNAARRCARDRIVDRLFVRRDTLNLVVWGPKAQTCPAGPGTADVVVIARTTRLARAVFNGTYGVTVTGNAWFEHRRAEDLDTMPAYGPSRVGWLEMMVREDSSVQDLRRLAAHVRSDAEGAFLLTSARFRNDDRALMAAGEVAVVRDSLLSWHGLEWARDSATPRETLERLLKRVIDRRKPDPVAAALYDNPAIGAIPNARLFIAQLGLLPGGVIAGRVHDSTGAARSAVIRVLGQHRDTTAFDGGNYRIPGIAPGEVRVMAWLTPVDSVGATLTVREGDTVTWNPVVADHYTPAAGQRPKLARYPGDDVDSAGRGLVKADTTRTATFRAFGQHFIAAAVAGQPDDANVVVSPLSAGLALALAAEGARNATAAAFATALGDGLTLERRRARITETQRLLAGRLDAQIALASAVWGDVALEIAPEFRSVATTGHHATVKTLQLATSAAATAVNRWADSVTFGRIRQIQDGPFSGVTRLVLANAAYFNGAWLDEFKTENTKPRPFAIGGGEPRPIPTMEIHHVFGYARATGFEMARLPYRAGRAAMYVVLPTRGVSRDSLFRLLRSHWPGAPSALPPTDLRLLLPRIHVEQALDLVPVLGRLGLGVALDHDRADFSGLGHVRHGPGDLAIGQAKQKVFLDVNEEGTEAAVVAHFEATVTSAPPPPTPFIVDRPFLFIVRDEVSGTDLFVGWIARPGPK